MIGILRGLGGRLEVVRLLNVARRIMAGMSKMKK